MLPNESSHLFGEYYYAHNCGDPYERTEAWLAMFDHIAGRIVTDFNPKTVLDAGCAKGFLVEKLREKGVEAWGVDISEYAIGSVHPSVKDYCFVGSITDPLPRNYDLIVTIEVVEHMPQEMSARAIENLCRHTNTVLFSSSPYDFKEATHINVHQPDFWAMQFARQGFYHDLDYDGTYLTDWAARFNRVKGPLQQVIQSYERTLWQMKVELKELRSSVIDYHAKLEAVEKEQATYGNQVALGKLQEYEQRIREMENTKSWRIAQKLQALRLSLAPPNSRREKLLKKINIL